MESIRNDFLDVFVSKQRELGQTQRLYKRLVDTRIISRTDKIRASNVDKTIQKLIEERNDLRAQIWVADGVCHNAANDQQLEDIQCLVDCLEHLSEDIHELRMGIKNLEHEISNVDKDTVRLNRQTVPDSRQQAHVARMKKRMNMLEAEYEAHVARECDLARENGKMRQNIEVEIRLREVFNQSYGRKVQRLTSDRKYLLELIEYALGIFETGINAYEKLENRKKKETKEKEQHKKEVQAVMRKACTEEEANKFIECKSKTRQLADLEPKEYRRREKFRKENVKKIELYKKILGQIKAYTSSENVASVIDRFREQESLYYSYFTYANELGYHITLLDISVSHIYTDIAHLRQKENNTLEGQMTTIATLEETLKEKQQKNELLKKRCEDKDKVIEQLLLDIHEIFEEANADFSPVEALLGDQTHVNLMNARAVMKVFEKRLNDVISCVYIKEHDDPKMLYDNYCVQDIDKFTEPPTPLNEIVMTQQCPECGEGDAHQDDAKALVVNTREETRKRLYEKITQPEMQYRLHTISQCRLPRSRLLVTKRNL